MSDDVFDHLCYRIANAPTRTYPYSHFFVDSLFPEEFYQELCTSFPDTEHYQKLSDTGKVPPGTYDKRYVLSLQDDKLMQLPWQQMLFWQRMAQFLSDPHLVSILVDKFRPEIQKRFGEHADRVRFSSFAELVRDYQHYSIGPHTDHPVRVVTLLFYFPQNHEKAHLGTSLYRPIDPAFTCEGTTHHRFEGFIRTQTMPFIPNSLFAFVKTERSFHGVEPIQDEGFERNLMNYYLRWEI